jgi:ATP-dependent helicase/nuclease subunit B
MPVILRKKYSDPVSAIGEEVRRRIQNRDTRSFIYVAPTKRKIRELQREFLRLTPRQVAPSFNLYTLETLATEMYFLLCPPRQLITGTIQSVLVDEAVRASAGMLQYFRFHGKAKRLPVGTLRRIINVLNSLNENGIYRSTLLTELEVAQPFEKPKLQDIITISDAYETLLGDRFVDAAGLYKHLNEFWEREYAERIIASRFPDVNFIFISGFDEFSDPELTMLYNLSEMKNTGMLVSFDYHPDNDEVFGHLKQNYSKFQEMQFSKVRIASGSDGSFAKHIIDHLFKYDANVQRYSGRDMVTVLAADTRVQEVELVATIIKSLVGEKPDRDLSKICVAMYRPELYTNLFRNVFDRFGIPANITDRYYLSQSPLVISILSLLGVLEHDFRIHDIMRVCSSPYMKIKNNGARITAGNVSEAAALLKIARGKKSWFKRIEQQLRRIQLSMSDVIDDFDAVRLHRENEMLNAAQADLAVLADLLKPFEGEMTPGEFKARLMTLLEKVDVGRSILEGEFNDEEKLEKDTRAYQKFLSFVDEFLSVLSFEEKDSTKNTLSFYLDRLRETIAQVRYNIRQKYGRGVAVTSFDETRGLQFEEMIIVGLVDGEFPPPYQPEIFFSADRRAQYERYYLHEHRYLFYQAITNFTEHLYITYPEMDENTELVPSSFIDAVIRIVDVQDYRNEIPPALRNSIYSKDKLIRYFGTMFGMTPGLQAVPSPLARYSDDLSTLLDHMRKSSRVETGRLNGTPLPEYNGVLGGQIDHESSAALQRLKEYTYSVTQLESYGVCPFQYYANRVLRLNVIKEVEEELTPLERGGVLHEILFEFYLSRRERKLPSLQGLDDHKYAEAFRELLEIANRKLGELNIPDIFWEIEKENITGSANKKGILREFLEMERSSTLTVTPRYFEVAFGSHVGSRKQIDPDLKYEQPITAGDVRLRGKIDRIDVGENIFRIVDYKTGKNVSGRKELDLGISLQLPIYLFAVEYILAVTTDTHIEATAGVYDVLRSPVQEKLGLGNNEYRDKAFTMKKSSRQIVGDRMELAEVIAQAVRFVNEYVDNIVAGNFPVMPKAPELSCRHCNFQTICRIRPEMLTETSTTEPPDNQ